MKPRFISFIPALIWLTVTFILLILPGPDIPKATIFDIIYFDKWVHIGMFGLLTILLGYPFLKQNMASPQPFFFIGVCVILYGISMEFVQQYFAFERSFDLFDMAADTIGCFLAVFWLVFKFKKIRNSRNI